MEGATAELESRGYRMLVKNKKEPWGQTVSRFMSPEGLLVGVTFTPACAKENRPGVNPADCPKPVLWSRGHTAVRRRPVPQTVWGSF